MKTHSMLGATSIERALRNADRRLDFLDMAMQIAHYHHEKWDGSGYPEGLKEDAIPIPARLMALADVFDALISRRVYKPPMPYEQAKEHHCCRARTPLRPRCRRCLSPQFRRIRSRRREIPGERR